MAMKERVFSNDILNSMQGVITQSCVKPTQRCYTQSFRFLLNWVNFAEVGKIVFIFFPIPVATFGRLVIRVFSLQP